MDKMNDSDIEFWKRHLVGKTLVDEDSSYSGDKYVKTSQLPKGYRVVKPNEFTTADFRADRLSVKVDDDGVVNSVKFG